MPRGKVIIKDRDLPIACGAIMAAAVPACAYVKALFKHPFDVPVHLFEIGGDGTFPWNISFVMNFLAMALVLNLVFWSCFKVIARLVARVNVSAVPVSSSSVRAGASPAPGEVPPGPIATAANGVGLARPGSHLSRKLAILEFMALLVIIASVAGVVFHWGFDRANGLYKDEHGMALVPVYLYLYWGDEYVGHALQELSLLGYFAVLVATSTLVPRDARRPVRVVDIPWIALVAGVMAVTNGYAALKSESAMIMLLASVAFLGIELVHAFRRDTNLFVDPLFMATLIGNVLVIVQGIYYIATIGIVPWYPWLRA